MTKRKKRCEPLERYRQLQGISLAELANRLGLAESTVRSLVNGTRQITAETAVLIEGRLAIPRETLRPDFFVKRAA